MIEAWSLLNFKKAMGEEVNLYRDMNGEKLAADARYNWDSYEAVFVRDERGEYGADEIKLLRLMMSSDLNVVLRVKVWDDMMERVLRLVHTVV